MATSVARKRRGHTSPEACFPRDCGENTPVGTTPADERNVVTDLGVSAVLRSIEHHAYNKDIAYCPFLEVNPVDLDGVLRPSDLRVKTET